MLETGLALLLGHLVADFLFQTDALARRKTEVRVLLLHVAVVALATWVALGVPPAPWLLGLVAGSHLLIDALKAHRGGPGFTAFAADQTAHLAVIVVAAALFPQAWAAGIWASPALPEPLGRAAPSAVALAAGLVAAVWAGSAAVRALMHGLALPSDPESLPQGGRLIGRLERLMILMLVLAGEAGAIGFLIAAKSVLRFGELTAERDRRVSEYVIIGTLASFAWALGAAFLTRAALDALAAAG